MVVWRQKLVNICVRRDGANRIGARGALVGVAFFVTAGQVVAARHCRCLRLRIDCSGRAATFRRLCATRDRPAYVRRVDRKKLSRPQVIGVR